MFPAQPIRSALLAMAAMFLIDGSQASGEDDHAELAPYMAALQQLTHKLSLSIGHDNAQLARFYLHESEELLEEIGEAVPEYEGFPIALQIEQIATPAYEALEAAMQAPGDGKALEAAHLQLIDSCNRCHAATQHGYIRITVPTGNPFNQDFRPTEP